MRRDLVIEWKHIGNDVSGTCERCSLTGNAIRDVLKELEPYFQEKGIAIEFRETVLPDSEIEVSNQVLLDGRPLEDYLAGSEVVQTPCCSCACITGEDSAVCRAIEVRGGPLRGNHTGTAEAGDRQRGGVGGVLWLWVRMQVTSLGDNRRYP